MNEHPFPPPGEPPPPFRQTLEHVDHGLALTDASGRLRWCNALLGECYLGDKAAASPLGRPYAEVFRALFLEPAQWRRVENALARLARAPKSRVEFENLAFGHSGCTVRRIDLVLCDLGAADDPAAGWVAWYFYDNTSLRRIEENLEALLHHSTDGIFMIDAHCRLRVFNQACERITGYPAEEVLHREVTCASVFQCAAPEGERAPERCAAERCAAERGTGPLCFLNGAGHQTRELLLRTRAGGQVWVEVSFAPVLDEEGAVAYVLGILRDVTQRHQLEDQLRVARKLATLGELTSAMAHEIKNPLGIILSAAEIIASPGRSEEQRRQAAEFIREETKRLDERMRVFLSFSRPRPPEFKPQSVHRVLTQTIIAYETLARGGLTLRTAFAASLPHAHIDADQMQQVFLNLIMNADQSMPDGGTITIATRRAEGEGVAVEIADQGPGLPEGAVDRLFEPFFSTKPRGTGLGLSIVMHIVTAHGGRIEARNREGGGAVFTVYLPALD